MKKNIINLNAKKRKKNCFGLSSVYNIKSVFYILKCRYKHSVNVDICISIQRHYCCWNAVKFILEASNKNINNNNLCANSVFYVKKYKSFIIAVCFHFLSSFNKLHSNFFQHKYVTGIKVLYEIVALFS